MVLVRAGQATTTSTGGAPTIENKTGADCTGVHGANNRTLDLAALATDELIIAQSSPLYPTQDYTKATVGGVSRITFLNKVYDEFFIRVLYWT